MAKLLTKEMMLEAEDLPSQEVDVPEWGGWVRLRGLSGAEASAFSSRLVRIGPDGKPQAVKLDNFMADLLSLCIVDESGQPLFSRTDVAALGRKSARVLKRLSDIATE